MQSKLLQIAFLLSNTVVGMTDAQIRATQPARDDVQKEIIGLFNALGKACELLSEDYSCPPDEDTDACTVRDENKCKECWFRYLLRSSEDGN